MATHHEIEKNHSDEFQVTASAPLAGPYDLEATVDTIIAWGRYKRPILMAYMMNSYDYYYGWNRLSEVFKEPWASEIPDYFDGTQGIDVINNRMPQKLDSLMVESFINDYKTGGETEFRNAVRENSLLNYVPSAPVRLIHGNADRTVPYSNSLAALEFYESQNKTNVDMVTVEGDHQTAAEAAIVGAMVWFKSLQEK
jgi:pimeloyl-ACP methyl ester carboxylesterase